MQKGFTLAESLITMAIIGIIMALSIPAVIQNTNDTIPLFKKAYNTVEIVVSELINDTALYPSGDLSAPASGTFCSNFLSKLNTIGTISCAEAAAVTPTVTAGNPPTTNADASTTNAMNWYNLHPSTGNAATSGFTTANCDTANTGIDVTGTPPANTCIKLQVDINGPNKGANTTNDQANKDIFTIYVTKSGKVAVETSAANTYDEAYILQN